MMSKMKMEGEARAERAANEAKGQRDKSRGQDVGGEWPQNEAFWRSLEPANQLWARRIGEASPISTQNRDRDFLTSPTHPDTSG